MKFNAWSFVRRCLVYGGAIEADARSIDRTYEENSAVLDARARELAAELEAALAAATVVPAEVVEAAEDMMNVIGVVFDKSQLTVAQWVLSLAAKGKGQNDLQDAAMLIRRLCAKLPDCKLSRQAQEWIHRKGLGGDVLREDTPAQQPGEE